MLRHKTLWPKRIAGIATQQLDTCSLLFRWSVRFVLGSSLFYLNTRRRVPAPIRSSWKAAAAAIEDPEKRVWIFITALPRPACLFFSQMSSPSSYSLSWDRNTGVMVFWRGGGEGKIKYHIPTHPQIETKFNNCLVECNFARLRTVKSIIKLFKRCNKSSWMVETWVAV